MLPNYLKLAFRQLWRNRLFTALNVLGLSIGLAACWMIFQLVHYEFSFDADQPNRERIYKIVTRTTYDNKESGSPGVPVSMADALKDQMSGIEIVVEQYYQSISDVQVPQASGKPLVFAGSSPVLATTGDYFQLVPYKWLAGTPTGALTEPNQVVLTQAQAEKYFPSLKPEKVLGKSVMYWDTLPVMVIGVVANLGRSSSFAGEAFLSLSTVHDANRLQESGGSWGSLSSDDLVYILLNPNTDPVKLAANINTMAQKASGAVNKGSIRTTEYELLPLAEEHFSTFYEARSRAANKETLFALMGLAGFLLVLAIVNFVNLTTAQIPQRAREIGIRKTLGSSAAGLIGHFLGETLIVTLLACGLAYVWTTTFRSNLSELFPEGFDLYPNIGQTLLFMTGLLLVVSLLAGWYPSLLITRFQPTQVLRGQVSSMMGRNNFSLRKSLIVFQFVIAQAFVIGAIIMNQQLHFALESDLGFDREAVITFQVPYEIRKKEAYQDKHFALKEEIRRLPEVSGVSLGNPPFSRGFASSTMIYMASKGKVERNVFMKYGDTDLLKTYDIKLLAGRNLLPSDTIREYIFNETAIREFGFPSPQEAIGKFIGDKKPIPIVGVMADFHSSTFDRKIEPLALLTKKDPGSNFNVKLASSKPADWQKGIQKMEKLWKQTYPDTPFEYKFYDDMIAQYYTSEQRMAKIINLSTGIAILISCLGLFGLATLTAFQRTKEIGVRKVLGASISGIVAMLSKDFVALVLIALVIASPIAWYFMDQWLADFAYHIDISWWVFALAGVTAMVIALLTVGYQSVRAALMNPVESLRSE
ncbi:FtsX-like permease family protein [Persicitalea sp.]|uniref:FtsX-like permease family protein n=1 Tax=Persicitalea sp. TaxID=3100273 RepID=UPI0035945492